MRPRSLRVTGLEKFDYRLDHKILDDLFGKQLSNCQYPKQPCTRLRHIFVDFVELYGRTFVDYFF